MARSSGSTEKVYQSIREEIMNGHFSPAENLRELDLATEYQVSRNTIKKALLMLDREGLVTIETNKGAKVRSYSLKEVLEFLEFRQVLEGFICRTAVPCFTQQDIDELFEILNQMERCKKQEQLVTYSQYNQKFHAKIFEVCPNRTAVEVTQNLKNQMRKYNTKTILIPSRPDQSYSEHTTIAQAIRAGDADAAEAAMKTHMKNVRDVFYNNSKLLF